MAIDRVKNYLKKFGRDKDIMEFDTSSATVSDAATTIGCSMGEIAKTLSFLVNDKPVLVVMAGDKKVDNHKYKETFKTKAKMIPSEDLGVLVGHDAGGVCPFGVNEGVVVYLDVSLKEYKYLYPACGSSNSAIKLSLDELEELSSFKEWVDIAKEI